MIVDDDFLPRTPDALRALNLDGLVGRTVEEAGHLIEAAGGHVRAVTPGMPVTADYRPDRVTLTVENGRVLACNGIG